MHFRSALATLALLAALATGQAAGAEAVTFPNAGFELGSEGWSWGNPEVSLSEEAAREGKVGLRIDVTSSLPSGTSINGSLFTVNSGADVLLTFWAKQESKTFCGVYLRFFDQDGRLLTDDKYKYSGGQACLSIDKSDGQWHEYALEAQAPQGAKTVGIWIHSWGNARGRVDLDDFSLKGVEADKAIPPPAVKQQAKVEAVDLANLPDRANPPMIVIKLDDLRPVNGKLDGTWKKVDNYLAGRGIKYSIGVICRDLAKADPEFREWVKTRHVSGAVEFWFHGWDHGTHEEDGTKYSEFGQRPYEDQRKRFADSQALARDILGFPFITFGPPGGGKKHFDGATIRAMADDPDMKVWLYSQPLDKAGAALADQSKVTILDRVWAVNIEGSVGKPDFGKLVAGFAQNPDRTYFVLQGHPTHWRGTRFDEFTRIIDFLIEQKAVFMTPTECAAEMVQQTEESQ